LGCFPLIQANLHRKFNAIFAQPEESSPRAHEARPRGHHELLAMAEMLGTEAFRQQPLNALAQQLQARVAEHGFHLRIDQQDFTRWVGHHHGIRGKFKEGAEFWVTDFSEHQQIIMSLLQKQNPKCPGRARSDRRCQDFKRITSSRAASRCR